MGKIDREAVKAKFDGRCAFCGRPLGKGWHTWDIEPIGHAINETGQLEQTGTELSNLLPACKPCGSVRIKYSNHKMTIEEFRKDIIDSLWVLEHSPWYQKCIRYNLVQPVDEPLIFYFERESAGYELPDKPPKD